MFCIKCGAKVAEGASFCTKCGAGIKNNNITQDNEAVTQTVSVTNEIVLFKSGGGHIVGPLGSGSGKIKLTSKRLIHETLGGKVDIEVDINDIVSYMNAYNYSSLGNNLITDNAFIINTKQGFAYKFSVGEREQLFQLFKQLIPSVEQLPHETEDEAKTFECPENHPGYQAAKKQRTGLNIFSGILKGILILVGLVIVISFLKSCTDGSLATNFNNVLHAQEITMVKDGKLHSYPNKTVGEAFDGFLTDSKWEAGVSEDGQTFVNVTGGALYLEKSVEVVVQFYVDADAGTFEYHACEINGVPQSDLIIWGLLEKAYE